MPIFPLLLCILLTAGLAGQSAAADLSPYPVTNQHPFIQLHGLPPVLDGSLAPEGGSALLTLQAASYFSDDQSGGERLFLDGESYRLELSFRRPIGERLELGLVVPWLFHRQGFLDGFIIDWHDTFGLPQGGRDKAPKDRLLFLYTRDGAEEIRFDRETEGLGDVRLTAGWQFHQTGQGGAALRASLKLPTGDSDRLLGSGGTDLALWVAADRVFTFAHSRLAIFGGAGGLLMEKGEVLPDRQRPLAFFGSLGAAWSPWQRIAFKLQTDGHTSLYHSEIDSLNGSLLLTIGGRVELAERTSLELAVSEDILVEAAPDVTFLINLRQTF